MTVQFLIYVTAAQWDRARSVDVPIVALSQYDRPWSLTNETRVTTYGYRAVQKASTLFSTSKLRRAVTIARVIVIPRGGFARRVEFYTIHASSAYIYNEVRKAQPSAMHFDNFKDKSADCVFL